MDLEINFNGNKKQEEVAKYWYDDSVETIVFSGGKSTGKEHIAINLIFIDAFSKPDTKYFIATKFIKSLIKYTHDKVEPILLNLGINRYCKFNILDYCWEFSNGSTIQYLDISFKEKDPYYDRLSCMQFNRGWIALANEIETNYGEDIYEERAIPKLYWSVRNSIDKKILHTCLPCRNYLYNDYYIKHYENRLEDENKFVISNFKDCTHLPKEFIDNINHLINDNKISGRYIGDWNQI